ncbi:transcription initiation factor TFIID TFIIF subunit [Phlyctema vagabunda]|uniref:Transcription initiation factor TFIID TFIIF subunit n=1 Tax=Phlyctema vagabunda TaxID=108571 RepID=A0ABR4PKQ2_9HELO
MSLERRSLQPALPRPSTTSIHRSRTLPNVSSSNASAGHLHLLTLRPPPSPAFSKPPFRCQNEGWGEFDMGIDLYTAEKGGKHSLHHDLNFAKGRYEAKHQITFKNPSAALVDILRESGPVPGDENGIRKKDGDKKRKRTAGSVDMEKLADGLVKLHEDDLLQVVQMIHDNKSDDTYTKNDVDQGEFHVDLYTLPDSLIKMLWDFVVKQQSA